MLFFVPKLPMVGLGRRRRRFGKCLWLVIGQSRNLPEWPLRQQRGFPALGSKQKQKKCKNLEVKGKMVLSNKGNKIFVFETRASLFEFAKLHGFEASVNIKSQIKATGHFVRRIQPL